MTTQYDVLLHIPSLHGGGAERVAVQLCGYFVQRKLRVAMFVHHTRADYDMPAGADVFNAGSRTHLGRVSELRALLKMTGVPVVISFLPYANLISSLARLGVVSLRHLIVSEHLSYSVLKPKELKQRLKLAMAVFLYRWADSIVAVSEGVADELKGRVDGKTGRKVTVIHNPCFIPGGLLRGSDLRPRGYAILAVGRLVHQKGFDTLVRAFARVRAEISDATLRIVGEGTDRAELEQLVSRLDLKDSVELPGFTKDVVSEYRSADLFVCASRAEGFGNVIVEAMSYGLPVVSTSCPHGPEEILQGGRFGALVPVDNEACLATEIIRKLRQPADPHAQVARAKDFSVESIGDRYIELAGLGCDRVRARSKL